ncbi:hypothetical protein DFJ74DRAFT_34507 [Hyaloraphidium curvatum]|nr:hypothetical protein DFJ74DRAFT_34507 [Hyaloraphidium curvatum]
MKPSFGPAPSLRRPDTLESLEGDLLDALKEESVSPLSAETSSATPRKGSESTVPGPAMVVGAETTEVEPESALAPTEIIVVRQKEAREQRDTDLESRLAALDKFSPLVPISTGQSSFSVMNMLGVSSSTASTSASADLPGNIDPQPAAALLSRIQAHMKACSDVVRNDQLLLSDLIKEVDDFCLKLATTMHQRSNVAHSHSDGLIALNNVRQHVERTKGSMRDILRTLGRLDPILDSEVRLRTCSDRQSFSRLLEVATFADGGE